MQDYSDKRIWNMWKQNYQRNVEVGILITLSGIILIFFSFQKYAQQSQKGLEIYPQFSIEMIEMPRTIQEPRIKKSKPQLPLIPVPAEETEILQEVTLIEEQLRFADSFGITGTKPAPQMAKQLFEAIPREPDLPIKGQITLSIKISVQGAVVEYRVIENTTGSEIYLNSVLEAIKKSRWQPARTNGTNVESWIEKIYRIDTQSTD